MSTRTYKFVGSFLASAGALIVGYAIYQEGMKQAPRSYWAVSTALADLSEFANRVWFKAEQIAARNHFETLLNASILMPTVALLMLSVFAAALIRRRRSSQRASAGQLAHRPRTKSEDRQFLPAALELIETPASPIVISLLWFVCLLFSATLAWSYFGKLDIYAIANGKIQASGGSKVIQPLSSGKVIVVHVENGKHVSAGDLLVELDPTETAADRQAQADELETAKAEIARRHTALAIARDAHSIPETIKFDAEINEDLRNREKMVMAADIAELNASRDSLAAQLGELDARGNKLAATIRARTKLLAVLQERVDIRNALDAQGQGYRSKVIDALQELERENTNFANDKGELAEIDANKRSVEKRISETTEKFISEQASKLSESEQKRDRLTQELIKAASKEKETQLIAPISGVVQQLSITTLGQVVAAGQSLMTIVPDDAPVEIEALFQNQDIGFVAAGQPVTIKVEAFPFTRYGTLEGIVLNVSRDGVDQRTAANLSDAPSITRPQGMANPTNTSTAQPLAFPARISIARSTITIDGRPVRLLPGMAVTAEVKTGQRRAIDYVLSPLREITTASLQER